MDHPYTQDYYIRLSEKDLNGDIQNLGVRKVHLSSQLIWHLFPNPASDHLTLKVFGLFSDDTVWKITDIMGRPYTSGHRTGETTVIDISQLPTGIYIMQMNDSGHQKHKRFTKK